MGWEDLSTRRRRDRRLLLLAFPGLLLLGLVIVVGARVLGSFSGGDEVRDEDGHGERLACAEENAEPALLRDVHGELQVDEGKGMGVGPRVTDVDFLHAFAAPEADPAEVGALLERLAEECGLVPDLHLEEEREPAYSHFDHRVLSTPNIPIPAEQWAQILPYVQQAGPYEGSVETDEEEGTSLSLRAEEQSHDEAVETALSWEELAQPEEVAVTVIAAGGLPEDPHEVDSRDTAAVSTEGTFEEVRICLELLEHALEEPGFEGIREFECAVGKEDAHVAVAIHDEDLSRTPGREVEESVPDELQQTAEDYADRAEQTFEQPTSVDVNLFRLRGGHPLVERELPSES